MRARKVPSDRAVVGELAEGPLTLSATVATNAVLERRGVRVETTLVDAAITPIHAGALARDRIPGDALAMRSDGSLCPAASSGPPTRSRAARREGCRPVQDGETEVCVISTVSGPRAGLDDFLTPRSAGHREREDKLRSPPDRRTRYPARGIWHYVRPITTI